MKRIEDISSLCLLDTRDAIEILGDILGVELCVCTNCAPDEELEKGLMGLLDLYMRHPPISFSMDTDIMAGVHSV